MGWLTLLIGLLLPWLAGVLWLALAESHLSQHHCPHRLRQAGYGFFLGYAILFLTILLAHHLTGTVSWPGLMLFLLLLSAVAASALWLGRGNTVEAHWHSNGPPASAGAKTLTIVLAVWIGIHLTFVTIEILTQPVYPWDAWLAWVYRAKAWFLAGGMVDVVSSGDWATASSTEIYTINAWMYPRFPSVIPYWAALSLGRWSETLINLPVLTAGLAIGMALYGQCREYGMSKLACLSACYLLYSIPLVGTHLALAGYADIWMAGFTGLGFVAVIRGSTPPAGFSRLNFQTVLGLLMVGLSVVVKNEGAVWLLAVFALLALTSFRLRVSFLGLVVLSAMMLMASAMGFTHIDLPLIGVLGVIDGRLLIPFIGSFKLEVHEIWQVYWENFMAMGNWNLFWLAVVASPLLGYFLSGKSKGNYRAWQVCFVFVLIFLATQVFIFGFTDQGLWADTYTAVNRLPLHFVPALLFVVLVTASASWVNIESRERTTRNHTDSAL